LKLEILQASTTLAADPFGQVKDGLLRVRARIIQMQVQPLYNRDYNGRLLCEVYLKGSKNERFKIWVNADEGLEPGEVLDKDIFCVPVESSITGEEGAVTGLLLQRTRRKKGEYQRYGLFKKWDDHKLYDRLTTYHADIAPIEEFEEDNGLGIYTISIV
jgi:hypothetical protein